MTDLIKRDDALNACSIVDWNAEAFELVDNALRALPATDRIEELETRNKDLALQLLATSGQAADALDKLTKAKEFLKTMADYNKYVIAPFLAELEKME